MNSFDKEYQLNKLCPYGSEKEYKYWFKNKSIRCGYKDGKLVKSVPVEGEFLKLIENQMNLFESMYNKKPEEARIEEW